MDGLTVLLNIATYSTFIICLVLKLPQILLLTKNKSSKGLSLKGLLLEQTGYIVFATYQQHHEYPLSSYVEYPILIVQDTILLILMLNYEGHLRQSIIYSLLFVVGWQLLRMKAWVIDMAMSVCTLISAVGKFSQIQCIRHSQDSSQVSALSSAMSTYSCIARTFTTLMTESDDMRVLIRICILTVLNTSILTTILYYRRGSKKQE